MKPLVKFLRVKTKGEAHRKTITDIFIGNARDDMMAGIEAIAGVHGRYFVSDHLSTFSITTNTH